MKYNTQSSYSVVACGVVTVRRGVVENFMENRNYGAEIFTAKQPFINANNPNSYKPAE